MLRTLGSWCVFVLGFIAILVLLCFPWRSSPSFQAFAENLWTSGDQNTTDFRWSNPCPKGSSPDLQTWHRTEFGLYWNYFVVDQCTENPSWYARLDTRVLLIYVVASGLGAAAVTQFMRLLLAAVSSLRRRS